TRPGLPDTLLVRNGGPSVIVEYIGPEVGGDGYAPPLVMGLRLRWPRERRPFQTLPLGVAAMSGSANALDVDGDSYADLVYGVAFGTYVYDYVWLYRPAERRYGDGMTFTGALQVDPETGAVWSTWSVGLCCRTGVDLYTVRDGEARLIRQWVTDKYVMTSPDSTNFEVSATIVCERRGDEMAQVEVRPGEDRYDAPGDRD
ncbi:MAG TPA: hypothetical protein VK610_05690, partial [Rhodothermales bacterium]|nr:hypothetical protein [Rhodothermales bacterium]